MPGVRAFSMEGGEILGTPGPARSDYRMITPSFTTCTTFFIAPMFISGPSAGSCRGQ